MKSIFYAIKLWTVLLFVLGLHSFQALAQTANTASDEQYIQNAISRKRQILESSIEGRAQKVLSQQLSSDNYILTTEIQLDSAKLLSAAGEGKEFKLRSLNRRLSTEDLARAFADQISPEELTPFIKSIQVSWSLDKSISKSLEETLLGAVKVAIGFNQKRGDAIKVTRIQLGQASSARLQEKAETLDKEIQKTLTEKTAMATALAASDLAKRQLEEQVRNLTNESESLKKEVTDLKRNALDETTFLGKIRKNIKGFELLITAVPFALILISGLLFMTLMYVSSQNKKSKNLNEGLQILATAMQKAGQLSAGAAIDARRVMGARDSSAGQLEAASQQSLTPQLSEGLELAQKEAEAAWLLLQKNSYPMLSVLKDWLNDEKGAQKFLAFSDAIGFSQSKELWARFPSREIEQLSQRAMEPVSKVMAYQTVSQVYRFAEATRNSRPEFSDELDLEFLISVTDADLAQAIDKSSLEAAAATLVFVSPDRAARVLDLVQAHSLKDIVAQMGRSQQLDKQIASELLAGVHAACDENKKSGHSFNVTKHIATLFESSSSEKQQEITQAIETNELLAQNLKSKMLTFDDVLKMEKDVFSDMLSELDSEQIAEIVFTIDEPRQNYIKSLLSPKIVFSISQDISRFQQKSSLRRRALTNGEKWKAMFVERMKAMIEEGLIDTNSQPQVQEKAS